MLVEDLWSEYSVGLRNCDQINPGMELRRAAVSPQGRLLAPQGTVLTNRHLRLFRMWGVTEVDIAGHDEEQSLAEPALTEAEMSIIQQTIDRRFQGALDHPVTREMARVAALLLRERHRVHHA